MARYKPAGSKKVKPSTAKGMIPCVFLLVMGFALVSYLFYAFLSSSK
jgi:hypothetical protein